MRSATLPEVMTAPDVSRALRVSLRTAQRWMRGERCARVCGKRVMRRATFLKAIERRERVEA